MKVTLLEWTANPLELVATLWDASKGTGSLESIRDRVKNNPKYCEELFEKIIAQEVPVAEAVSFTFMCEDVPISWREQAVRHRVGTSFWSQSMRIQNMNTFAVDRQFFIPETISNNDKAVDEYYAAMYDSETRYERLLSLDIPMEDARNVIPLGATHRISMTMNVRSFQHIIGERLSWILQASLWHPVIEQMIEELATKIHPIFRKLATPPCVKGGQFVKCVFQEENQRRLDGRDNFSPCPMWVHSEKGAKILTIQRNYKSEYERLLPKFAKIWNQPDFPADWKWHSGVEND